MKKRAFLKSTAALTMGAFLPSPLWAMSNRNRLRTAHIGVGNMGGEDLKAISSHGDVDVVALCDVDKKALDHAKTLHPNARLFADYRLMLQEMQNDIDAVIEVLAVFQQGYREINIEAVPAFLSPSKGVYGLRDYEKTFCPDLDKGLDIFDERDIDRGNGCIVVVRPDQHVASILPLGGFKELAAFFDGFMIARR